MAERTTYSVSGRRPGRFSAANGGLLRRTVRPVNDDQAGTPYANGGLPEEIPADFDYSTVDWDKVILESEVHSVTVEGERELGESDGND